MVRVGGAGLSDGVPGSQGSVGRHEHDGASVQDCLAGPGAEEEVSRGEGVGSSSGASWCGTGRSGGVRREN